MKFSMEIKVLCGEQRLHVKFCDSAKLLSVVSDRHGLDSIVSIRAKSGEWLLY